MDRRVFLKSAAAATAQALELAKEAGCRRVIFASSVNAVFGYPPDVQVSLSAPARPIHSQRNGARSAPNRENGVVKSTGSGFHDGPFVVTRSHCVISRPQMIHAHGS